MLVCRSLPAWSAFLNVIYALASGCVVDFDAGGLRGVADLRAAFILRAAGLRGFTVFLARALCAFSELLVIFPLRLLVRCRSGSLRSRFRP